MRLTPIDVLNKRFPSAMRGYARAVVEDFLRELAADYEETVAENARLRERAESLEREIERYRALETTLKEALILAQKTADETRAHAHREAETTLREAQARAAALTEEAERRAETVRQQRLRFVREFRATLQAYLDSLAEDAGTRSDGHGGDRETGRQGDKETDSSFIPHPSSFDGGPSHQDTETRGTPDSRLPTHDSQPPTTQRPNDPITTSMPEADGSH